MGDPGVTFTSGQISAVLCAALGALGTITAAAIRLLYSNVMKRFSSFEQKLKIVEIREHNLMRSVFVLLTRLHPDKAAVIVEVMEQAFSDSVLTPSQPNGSVRGSTFKT